MLGEALHVEESVEIKRCMLPLKRWMWLKSVACETPSHPMLFFSVAGPLGTRPRPCPGHATADHTPAWLARWHQLSRAPPWPCATRARPCTLRARPIIRHATPDHTTTWAARSPQQARPPPDHARPDPDHARPCPSRPPIRMACPMAPAGPSIPRPCTTRPRPCATRP